MLRQLILSLLVLGVGTACAGTPHVGDTVDVQGTLTMRGNEPFTYPVLSSGTKVWQLVGVDRAVLVKLQNSIVHVTGHVDANAVPSGLPAIRVDRMTEGEAKAP